MPWPGVCFNVHLLGIAYFLAHAFGVSLVPPRAHRAADTWGISIWLNSAIPLYERAFEFRGWHLAANCLRKVEVVVGIDADSRCFEAPKVLSVVRLLPTFASWINVVLVRHP